MTQQLKEWEERFDEKFAPTPSDGEKILTYSIDSNDAKSFFHQELLSLLQRKSEEIEGLRKTNCGCPPFESKHDGPCRDGDYTDFNLALTSAQAILLS